MTNGRKRRQVLLVDASREFCLLTERMLKRVDESIVTFDMPDGQSALDYLGGCGSGRPLPDLVLVDRTLPGSADGFDVLRSIRRTSHLQALMVLMCCGSDDPEHVAMARQAGANDYLVKAVEVAQYLDFARAIHAWLEQSCRTSGGAPAELGLAVQAQGLSFAPNQAMSAAILPAHPAADPTSFMHVVEFFIGKAKEALDPVQVSINELCRRHCIPEAHARGRGQDQVTVANRNAVIQGMMTLGYSDRVILDNFVVSQRHVERLRAAWRLKRGGVLALAKS